MNLSHKVIIYCIHILLFIIINRNQIHNQFRLKTQEARCSEMWMWTWVTFLASAEDLLDLGLAVPSLLVMMTSCHEEIISMVGLVRGGKSSFSSSASHSFLSFVSLFRFFFGVLECLNRKEWSCKCSPITKSVYDEFPLVNWLIYSKFLIYSLYYLKRYGFYHYMGMHLLKFSDLFRSAPYGR